MNMLQLFGRLGADPESRFTSGGQKVTTIRIACNSRKGGKDETIWWRVTVWGDRFDKMMSYLKKGSAIIVYGTMNKPEIYNDREGRPQVSMEMTAESLHFSPFGGKGEQTPSNETNERSEPQHAPAHAGYQSQAEDIEEEPMPF